MSSMPDPIREGLARGWKVAGGPRAPAPASIDCDVAIIGSGAGGGVSAELLSRAGLNVVMVEEGPLRSPPNRMKPRSRPRPFAEPRP